MSKIIIPLPARDFDPSEAAIPWKILSAAGIKVIFSTPLGAPASCDQRMLLGKDLGLLAPLLRADKNAQHAFSLMNSSAEYLQPIPWAKISAQEMDGILLPGGHAKGMREYLESELLQKSVAEFFSYQKPVAAICHGVVLVARSKSGEGKSVLHGRKTTCLLQSQELTAWALTRLWLGDYYRTYEFTVEAEVKLALASKSDFVKGPTPLLRDTPENLGRGFFVRDGNYLSARWPGDAHIFATEFLKILKAQQPS